MVACFLFHHRIQIRAGAGGRLELRHFPHIQRGFRQSLSNALSFTKNNFQVDKQLNIELPPKENKSLERRRNKGQ